MRLESSAVLAKFRVLNVVNLKYEAVADHDLEAGENVLNRFLLLQLDVAKVEAHEVLSVDGDLERGVGEAKGKLERLTDGEGEIWRASL